MNVDIPASPVTVESLCKQIEDVGTKANHLIDGVRAQRDEAIAMLADWVARVSECGAGWDDWDEAYKDAAYRPCGIRERLR